MKIRWKSIIIRGPKGPFTRENGAEWSSPSKERATLIPNLGSFRYERDFRDRRSITRS